VNARLLILATALLFQGCSTRPAKPPENLLALTEAQMKIRSYQIRVFDLSDQQKALRAVVSALMDLGFIIERVNSSMGLVTAAKFSGRGNSGFVETTVMVLPKGKTQMEIRANALFNTQPIDDPKVYQDFFNTLQKSLFSS
jgi:hypothetical protein